MSWQSTSGTEVQQRKPFFEVIKEAELSARKYFFSVLKDINFILLIFISLLTPIWEIYIRVFGDFHLIDLFEDSLPPGSIPPTLRNLELFNKPFLVEIFEKSFLIPVFAVVVLYVLSWSLFNRTQTNSKPLKLSSFTKQVTWPWTVEGIKASIIIVAAYMCFIIPGIIKTIHYAFFSFVVFFNSDYKARNLNCLKHSKKLSKGVRLWLFVLVIVFPSFIFVIPAFIKNSTMSLTNNLIVVYPMLALALYTLCMFLVYVFSILCFLYFIQENKHRKTH